MIRILWVATLVFAVSEAAWGQSSTSDRTAAEVPENLRLGGERSGTPGNWVQAAITRHRDLTDRRVNAPRGGGEGGTLAPNEEESSGGTTGSGTGGLSDLLGGLGDLGSLGGLLGTSGSGTTGTSNPMDLLQQLIALRDANTKSINTAQESTTISAKTDTQQVRQFGGAIARLPKADERFQTDGDSAGVTEEKFLVRWGDAMLQSVFTAVTFGLQSSDFIDAIKEALRPLFFPPADTDGDTDGDGNGGDDEDGGGIEDLDGSGGDDDDGGGSII